MAPAIGRSSITRLVLSPKSRPSRMDEGLDVLKLAWTGKPFGYHGRHYDFDEIQVQPAPLQKPHPPLWVAATAPAAAARAGRHGANLAGATVAPEVFDAYLSGLAESGIAQADVRISAAWSIVVTNEDPEKKWGRYKDLYFERWDFFRRIRSEMGDEDLLLNDKMPPVGTYRENDLVGSPSFITDTLREFAQRLPLTDIVYASPTAGIPIRDEAYHDMKLFADTVMPEIKSW